MATIQIRVDENTKAAADSLFSSLGLDTSTAVRIFLVKALEHNGIPFAIASPPRNSWRPFGTLGNVEICMVPSRRQKRRSLPCWRIDGA